MTDHLTHRGPDERGLYLDKHIGLGHRRLSILDVAGGQQPLQDSLKKYTIVYNGEIYNYLELRSELESDGFSFATNTDTEVLLYLLMKEGVEALPRLNGMFAFAFYNSREQTVLLATDRMGKKPLMWADMDGQFIFASEIKALLSYPGIQRVLNQDALNHYLVHEHVPAPLTLFEQIFKFLPSSYKYIKLGNSHQQVKKYWSFTFKPPLWNSIDEAGEDFRERFKLACNQRLMSEVPLGVFLSGGIDSSAVVAGLRFTGNHSGLTTFSIGFKEESYDESHYAKLVADHFQTQHHLKRLGINDLLDLQPRIAEIFDEPLADASIYPTYYLSQFTREHVTVALGGDGSDELFAGYDLFPAHKVARVLDYSAGFLLPLLKRISSSLKTSAKNMSLDFRLRQFLAGYHRQSSYRHQRWLGGFVSEVLPNLLTKEMIKLDEATLYDDLVGKMRDSNAKDLTQIVTALYVHGYLPDDILVKVDRCSMATSLEVRAPFLDPQIVDLAARLPSKWRFPGLKQKNFLKFALAPLLPNEVVSRKKKGFGIPVAAWLRQELKPLLLEVLDKGYLKRQGIFNPEVVGTLVEEHLTGRINHKKPLWTLIQFQLWFRQYKVKM